MNKHKAKYIFKNGQIIENSSIDAENVLITPGFVNFHAHLQYTDLKPYFIPVISTEQAVLASGETATSALSCDLSTRAKALARDDKIEFTDWITDLVKQYFFWNKDKKIKSFQNGLKETIKSGVTCVVNLAIEEEFIEVLDDFQIKSYSFLETFADTEERADREFKKLTKTLEKYNTSNIGISPHAPYNVHPSMWKKLAELNVLLHTHLFESADEMRWMEGLPSGINKLHNFLRFKTFKPYTLEPSDNLIAAHLCQKEFDEVRGYNIAHCPRSNMLLHGKTLSLSGDTSHVGLGTDSKFSNHDLNILHEAKFLRDRSNLSFIEIMNILTTNPRRMLNLPQDDEDFLVFKLAENECPESILDRDAPDEMWINGQKYRL